MARRKKPPRRRGQVLCGVPLARARARPLAAHFVERPNRFAAVCRLRNGEFITAHLANPGRLTGTLVPSCRVLLDGPFPGPRRFRYSVVGVWEGRTLVGVTSSFANRLFPHLLMGGLFPELPPGELQAEVRAGRSRLDFRVGRMFVEVKSVTLARSRNGYWPDAVTARGKRHCLELAAIARRHVPAAIVFVAQRGDVDSVTPEEAIDPAFAAALRGAAADGVRVLACSVELTPVGVHRARRIPVVLRRHATRQVGAP